MVRIKITADKPFTGEMSIAHLIGQEFEIVKKDSAGYYINSGPTGLYLIKETECEVIE